GARYQSTEVIAGRDQSYELTVRWKAERRARRRGPVRARCPAKDALARPAARRARIQQDSCDNAGRSHEESEWQAAGYLRGAHAREEDESQWCSSEKANPDEN